jgi:hypothetical protein
VASGADVDDRQPRAYALEVSIRRATERRFLMGW